MHFNGGADDGFRNLIDFNLVGFHCFSALVFTAEAQRAPRKDFNKNPQRPLCLCGDYGFVLVGGSTCWFQRLDPPSKDIV
jgi:hypothetical protein